MFKARSLRHNTKLLQNEEDHLPQEQQFQLIAARAKEEALQAEQRKENTLQAVQEVRSAHRPAGPPPTGPSPESLTPPKSKQDVTHLPLHASTPTRPRSPSAPPPELYPDISQLNERTSSNDETLSIQSFNESDYIDECDIGIQAGDPTVNYRVADTTIDFRPDTPDPRRHSSPTLNYHTIENSLITDDETTNTVTFVSFVSPTPPTVPHRADSEPSSSTAPLPPIATLLEPHQSSFVSTISERFDQIKVIDFPSLQELQEFAICAENTLQNKSLLLDVFHPESIVNFLCKLTKYGCAWLNELPCVSYFVLLASQLHADAPDSQLYVDLIVQILSSPDILHDIWAKIPTRPIKPEGHSNKPSTSRGADSPLTSLSLSESVDLSSQELHDWYPGIFPEQYLKPATTVAKRPTKRSACLFTDSTSSDSDSALSLNDQLTSALSHSSKTHTLNRDTIKRLNTDFDKLDSIVGQSEQTLKDLQNFRRSCPTLNQTVEDIFQDIVQKPPHQLKPTARNLRPRPARPVGPPPPVPPPAQAQGAAQAVAGRAPNPRAGMAARGALRGADPALLAILQGIQQTMANQNQPPQPRPSDTLHLLPKELFSGSEPKKAKDHWQAFYNYVRWQQAHNNLQQFDPDILRMFALTLSNPATSWYKSLPTQGHDAVTSLRRLEKQFKTKYNPWGSTVRDLEDSWDRLTFNIEDDLDGFMGDVVTLGALLEKTPLQRITKIKRAFPTMIQTQLVGLNTLDEVKEMAANLLPIVRDAKVSEKDSFKTIGQVLAHAMQANTPAPTPTAAPPISVPMPTLTAAPPIVIAPTEVQHVAPVPPMVPVTQMVPVEQQPINPMPVTVMYNELLTHPYDPSLVQRYQAGVPPQPPAQAPAQAYGPSVSWQARSQEQPMQQLYTYSQPVVYSPNGRPVQNQNRNGNNGNGRQNNNNRRWNNNGRRNGNQNQNQNQNQGNSQNQNNQGSDNRSGNQRRNQSGGQNGQQRNSQQSRPSNCPPTCTLCVTGRHDPGTCRLAQAGLAYYRNLYGTSNPQAPQQQSFQ